MATDPTQNIRRRVLASPFQLAGDTLVSRFEELALSTDVPYLTISVDWRVEGPGP